MDLHYSAITTTTTAFFTFLFFFAGTTTARVSFYPSPADLPLLPTTAVKPLPEKPQPTAGDSKIVLPTEISKSDSDASKSENSDFKIGFHKTAISNIVSKSYSGESESEKSRLFGVDLTPRTTDFDNFARFHAINRHFFDEPRVPVRSEHRHFVNQISIPRSEISSHGEREVKFSGNFDVEEASHRRAPAKRMKVKHDYGHRNHHLRHHNHQHHRNHLHLHHNNDGSVPKHVSDREKVKITSVSEKHMEKSINREHHEAGFMNQFRKFLKHTFD